MFAGSPGKHDAIYAFALFIHAHWWTVSMFALVQRKLDLPKFSMGKVLFVHDTLQLQCLTLVYAGLEELEDKHRVIN